MSKKITKTALSNILQNYDRASGKFRRKISFTVFGYTVNASTSQAAIKIAESILLEAKDTEREDLSSAQQTRLIKAFIQHRPEKNRASYAAFTEILIELFAAAKIFTAKDTQNNRRLLTEKFIDDLPVEPSHFVCTALCLVGDTSSIIGDLFKLVPVLEFSFKQMISEFKPIRGDRDGNDETHELILKLFVQILHITSGYLHQADLQQIIRRINADPATFNREYLARLLNVLHGIEPRTMETCDIREILLSDRSPLTTALKKLFPEIATQFSKFSPTMLNLFILFAFNRSIRFAQDELFFLTTIIQQREQMNKDSYQQIRDIFATVVVKPETLEEKNEHTATQTHCFNFTVNEIEQILFASNPQDIAQKFIDQSMPAPPTRWQTTSLAEQQSSAKGWVAC